MKIQNCKVGMPVVSKRNGRMYRITGVDQYAVEVELLITDRPTRYITDPRHLRKVLKEIKP